MPEDFAVSFLGYEFVDPIMLLISVLCSCIIIYISFFKTPKSIIKLLGIEKRQWYSKNDLFLLSLGLMQLIALMLISISAGGPIKTKRVSVDNREVRDIYFVVDVSRSMLADDFSPNRLEVAKKYIKEFIDLRSDDRIGLNIFAEKIITLSPLTLDHKALLNKVNDVSVGFLVTN